MQQSAPKMETILKLPDKKLNMKHILNMPTNKANFNINKIYYAIGKFYTLCVLQNKRHNAKLIRMMKKNPLVTKEDLLQIELYIKSLPRKRK